MTIPPSITCPLCKRENVPIEDVPILASGKAIAKHDYPAMIFRVRCPMSNAMVEPRTKEPTDA